MTDIIPLGFSADTRDLQAAAGILDRLPGQVAGVERAVVGLGSEFARLAQSFAAASRSGGSFAADQDRLARAAEFAGRAVANYERVLGQLGATGDSVARVGSGLAGTFTRNGAAAVEAAGQIDRYANAINEAASATARSTREMVVEWRNASQTLARSYELDGVVHRVDSQAAENFQQWMAVYSDKLAPIISAARELEPAFGALGSAGVAAWDGIGAAVERVEPLVERLGAAAWEEIAGALTGLGRAATAIGGELSGLVGNLAGAGQAADGAAPAISATAEAIRRVDDASAEAAQRVAAMHRSVADAGGGFSVLDNALNEVANRLSALEQQAGGTGGLTAFFFGGGTPWLAAAAAATAAVAIWDRASGASATAEQQVQRLATTLHLTGNASGVLAGQVRDFAATLSETTGQSVEGIMAAANELARAGNRVGPAFTDTLRVAAQMAAVLGTDVPSALQRLNRDLQSPLDNLGDLWRLGVRLDDHERQLIATLSATGREAAAQGMVFDRLAAVMGDEASGLTGRTNRLAAAWNRLLETIGQGGPDGTALGRYFDTVGGAIAQRLDTWTVGLGGGTAQLQIQVLSRQLAEAQRQLEQAQQGPSGFLPGLRQMDIDAAQSNVDRLTGQLAAAQARLAQQQAAAAAAAASAGAPPTTAVPPGSSVAGRGGSEVARIEAEAASVRRLADAYGSMSIEAIREAELLREIARSVIGNDANQRERIVAALREQAAAQRALDTNRFVLEVNNEMQAANRLAEAYSSGMVPAIRDAVIANEQDATARRFGIGVMDDEFTKITRAIRQRHDFTDAQAASLRLIELEIDRRAALAEADTVGLSGPALAVARARLQVLQEANQAALQGQRYSQDAVEQMAALAEETARIRAQTEQLGQVWDTVWGGAKDAVVELATQGRVSWLSLENTVLSGLAKIGTEAAGLELFGSAGAGGFLRGLFGGGSGGAGLLTGAGQWLGRQAYELFGLGGDYFERGGIMTAQGPLPLQRYGLGGIADTPQVAIYGEGRRPEAYVPLPDGRSIPVTMRGGGTTIHMGGIVISGAGDPKAVARAVRAELQSLMDDRSGRSTSQRHAQMVRDAAVARRRNL